MTKTKNGIERLDGFKFYEIFDPYFALIKAKDEDNAVRLYVEFVAGEESDFEVLKGSLKEVDRLIAVGKYYGSYYGEPLEVEQTLEEYFEYLLEDNSRVLLIDGSLI